ncbi:protein shisa-1-like [Rhinophrynus dorsalis]
MHAMLIIALVLVASCRAQHGEYCHGWADTYGIWHPGAQCPERYDPPDATFCCGSCALRYCCSAIESRLDQGMCPSESPLDMHGDGEPAIELPATVPTYFPFLLVGSMFLSFVIIGSLVGVCCCKCLKPEDETQASGPVPIQSRLLDTEPSTDLSRHSSSSSTSVTRPPVNNRPQNLCSLGAENINLFMNMPPAFSMMGCPQNAQFVHPGSAGPHFLQPPYINYAVPGEHTIIMAPAPYIDARNCYGQATNTYCPVNPQGDQTVCTESPSKC